jgi:hypothetical protein
MILKPGTLTEYRVSFEETNSLLDHFIRSAMKTTSTFQQGKTGDNPSVAHITGTAGFKSAKKALDRDLSHILSTRPVEQSGLHAVHFSDINGLSRLEVNILAHEILEYLGENDGSLLYILLILGREEKLAVIRHPVDYPEYPISSTRLGDLIVYSSQ